MSKNKLYLESESLTILVHVISITWIINLEDCLKTGIDVTETPPESVKGDAKYIAEFRYSSEDLRVFVEAYKYGVEWSITESDPEGSYATCGIHMILNDLDHTTFMDKPLKNQKEILRSIYEP